MAPKPRPPEDRFWAKVDKNGPNGCWLWTGAIMENGYGVFDGRFVRSRLVHRIAYEIAIGPIPDGLVVDHLCLVRHCVNPTHLEAVTVQENLARRDAARPDYCIHGHLLDEANTYVRAGTNQRKCRACHRNEANRAYAKRRRLME